MRLRPGQLGILAGWLLLLFSAPTEAAYQIRFVAGSEQSGYSGDGGPALSAQLDRPAALTFAPNGALYIADSGNNRIRAIDVTGTINTVAGSGVAASTGDGSSATEAGLDNPRDVAVDAAGNIFIVEGSPARVRRVDASTGTISTFLGAGLADYAVANSPSGNVLIALSPTSQAYGVPYLLTLWIDGAPFDFAPVLVANRFPYDLAVTDGLPALLVTGPYEHALVWQDDRLLWNYDREEYSLNGPFGVALSANGRIYVTASAFYSGITRFVLRARRQHFTSIAGGGAGDVVNGARADAVALAPTAIAIANDGTIHVVHRPSQIVALDRQEKEPGRIAGLMAAFPGSLAQWNARTTSIYAAGDNGVFRITRPNPHGRFRFDDLSAGRYRVYVRFDEEGFSCDAQNCGWSGAPDDCPLTLNDAFVNVTQDSTVHMVSLYLLQSFPCI